MHSDDVDLDDLLLKTSRTFALAIPLLPEPTRRAVGVAYLLFRVADTYEDAGDWPRHQRIEGLERFVELLRLPRETQAKNAQELVRWSLEKPPVTHAGYLELLGELPALLESTWSLAPLVREHVISHTIRTAEGMAHVVSRSDERGNLRLQSVSELKDYCYLVAGIVGELLTEVFLHDTAALRHEAASLRATMLGFGEGLQLVNILKDAGDDARDGRVYLPSTVARADIFTLARADLQAAQKYVQALQHGEAPRGYLAFCGISLVLAIRALEVLEAKGPGAKVSRDEVGVLFGRLQEALESGGALDLHALARA